MSVEDEQKQAQEVSRPVKSVAAMCMCLQEPWCSLQHHLRTSALCGEGGGQSGKKPLPVPNALFFFFFQMACLKANYSEDPRYILLGLSVRSLKVLC